MVNSRKRRPKTEPSARWWKATTIDEEDLVPASLNHSRAGKGSASRPITSAAYGVRYPNQVRWHFLDEEREITTFMSKRTELYQ